MIVLKLTKVLLKNFEMIAFEKRKSKVFFALMAILTYMLIMIPAGIMVGIISYGMTDILISNNTPTIGINLLLFCITIFSFVFCINVILNVFYFSSDIEHLLPMPIKPHEIIGAKFISSLISESAMQFILVLSSLLGFLIAIKGSIISYFYSFIAIVTIPIIPLCYCGIICILLMAFVRFIRNKDTINKISGIFIGLIIILSIVLLSLGISLDIDSFTLGLQDSLVIKILGFIFPNVICLTNAINNNSFLWFLLYLLINVLFVFVFLLTAKLLYFKGLIGLNSVSKKKNKKIIFKSSNQFISYLKKEFKILFKTPGFFMNCVIINFIWPIFIFLLIKLCGKTNSFLNVMDKYYNKDPLVLVLFIIGVIISSILITAINSIASSALSREGDQFIYIKLLPISYEKQLNAKALSSIIITFSGIGIYLIGIGIYLNIGILNILLYLLISLLSIVFVSYFGLFLDTINPKLIWDDEMNSLRGNHTVFINMAICIIVSAIVVLMIYGLYLINFPYLILSIAILLIMITLSIYLCFSKGIKNINKIE